MLISLFIKNFALVDEVALDFMPGLNVLTGETGAGKSIIVDAVQILTGERASSEYIRSGREKARVQGVFDISGLPELTLFLEEHGFEPEEDGTLILSRELSQGGKNVCLVNRQAATLSLYREIGRRLVDLHGQQEHQALFSPERQRHLLDRYGGAELQGLLEETKAVFNRWQAVKKELYRVMADAGEKERNIDLLKHQLQEIDGAGLRAGEEKELLAEINFLEQAEKITRLAGRGHGLLYEGEAGRQAVIDMLGEALGVLRELAAAAGEGDSLVSTVESFLYQLEDVVRELVRLREKAECDPRRLAAVQERLETIGRLKRKYGKTEEEILQRREEIAAEMACLAAGAETVTSLREDAAAQEKSWRELSAVVSGARRKAAAGLEEKVNAELAGLEMGSVDFQVSFLPLAEPSPYGPEKVEFFITSNPGEPPKPLARIASGGEAARIMLALKTILAAVDQAPTLIFDEIDAGIGGRTLVAVAERLVSIGRCRQVVCVTHAARIAAAAGTHYTVFKEVVNGRAGIGVRLLDKEERLDEIVRMLGGTGENVAVREHAREMLEYDR